MGDPLQFNVSSTDGGTPISSLINGTDLIGLTTHAAIFLIHHG